MSSRFVMLQEPLPYIQGNASTPILRGFGRMVSLTYEAGSRQRRTLPRGRVLKIFSKGSR